MFVCLRGFVYVVFGLWLREKKNLKLGVGREEKWSWKREGNQSLARFCGVHRRKICFLLGFVMAKE